MTKHRSPHKFGDKKGGKRSTCRKSDMGGHETRQKSMILFLSPSVGGLKRLNADVVKLHRSGGRVLHMKQETFRDKF